MCTCKRKKQYHSPTDQYYCPHCHCKNCPNRFPTAHAVLCEIFDCLIDDSLPIICHEYHELEYYSDMPAFYQFQIRKIVARAKDWNQYTKEYLTKKLYEEIREFKNAETPEEKCDELLDIANFCAFLWLHLKKEGIGRDASTDH